MKKRVLIFSLNYYPQYIGGAEVAIKEVVDRIPDEEIVFHMVTLRFDSMLPRHEHVGKILVHRIGFTTPHASIGDLKKFPLHLNKYLFQFWAPFYATYLHMRYRYDGIWAMMAHSCGVPAAIFKLFHPDVKYLLTLQEGDPPEYIERLARPVWLLFVRAFTSADVVQVISTFLGKWAKRMGYAGDPVVIPNAVNIAHFSQVYPKEDIDALGVKLGKKEGDVFLITTSRLVHKNAVDDVIRALPLLPQKVHFLILGIGPDEEKLRELAKSEKVEERVTFIGQVDHREMPKYLRVSDIFIRPSRSEGMGNSFVEAMAAGLPVIATQEGGISDFLFDKKRNPSAPSTGWAVSKDSPREIADAVNDILDQPDKTQEVIKTAKKLACEKYDWDLIAHNMNTQVFHRLFS